MENGRDNYSQLSRWCNLHKRRHTCRIPLAMVAFPLGGHENGTKKQRERAKLMAAAPELLRALQGMLERFDYNDQAIYSFATKEIDAAKAAIKKAIE